MISKTPALWLKRKHYKWYPDGDHIYEVVWIGKHSETEEFLVVYKPLFNWESTWLWEAQYACRPLDMWYDQIEYQWNVVSRFTLIQEG